MHLGSRSLQLMKTSATGDQVQTQTITVQLRLRMSPMGRAWDGRSHRSGRPLRRHEAAYLRCEQPA